LPAHNNLGNYDVEFAVKLKNKMLDSQEAIGSLAL